MTLRLLYFLVGEKCCKALENTGSAAGSYIYLSERGIFLKKINNWTTYCLQLTEQKITRKYLKHRRASSENTVQSSPPRVGSMWTCFCPAFRQTPNAYASWWYYSDIPSCRHLSLRSITRQRASFTAGYISPPLQLVPSVTNSCAQ